MGTLLFPETHQGTHVAFARIAAKSDWLAAANCLDLAFKRTGNGCQRYGASSDHRLHLQFRSKLSKTTFAVFFGS